jgi:hypothetical protein
MRPPKREPLLIMFCILCIYASIYTMCLVFLCVYVIWPEGAATGVRKKIAQRATV